MGYRIKEVYDAIDTLAPFKSCMEWDNVGLLVGSADEPVTGILVTLDVTPEAVIEAKRLGANCIVSHHPVIFEGLKCVGADSVPGMCLAAGISIISAHTNYDFAPQGVNYALASVLGLRNIRPFGGEEPCGMLGELPALLTAAEAASFCEEVLRTHIQYVPCAGKIRTVAVCGGAGSDFLPQAAAAGAEAFLTGEVKHHEWFAAAKSGICLMAGGHHAAEQPAVPQLARQLCDALPGLGITVFDSNPTCWGKELK